MKKALFCLSNALLLLALFGCSGPESKTYSLGDTGPAGGIVFYDQGSTLNGWRYLEAAPYDQSSSGIQWCGTLSTTGVTATAIASGKGNTTAIVTSIGAGSYAAQLCNDLTLGGYSDWYLPSKDELVQMLQYLAGNGLGNVQTNGVYWSSSEDSFTNAWDGCYGPLTASYSKDNSLRVRATRQF